VHVKESGRDGGGVLVVASSLDRAELLATLLDREVLRVSSSQVETPEAAAPALSAGTWDVLIADFGIPDTAALTVLGELKTKYAVPVILVAGRLDRDQLLALLRAGIDDYVSREELGELPEAVHRLVGKNRSGQTGPASRTEASECGGDLEEPIARGAPELQTANDRPEAEAKSLPDISALASAVAHELRNPLAVIQTAVYNIRKKRENKNIDKHLAAIDRKITESNLIISNLLNYSRRKQPVLEEADLSEVIRRSLVEAQGRSPRRDVTVVQHTDSIRRERFTADPGQLGEVFKNILVNAYQAIGEGGGSITVTAGKDAAGKNLLIAFEDTGEGMDQEVIRRAFDPFFTTKSKGTGLGLTICRDIVRSHGGSLAIKSREGQGTTVTVSLPVRPCRRIPVQRGGDRLKHPPSG
jgi:signal transduction histidine kinase